MESPFQALPPRVGGARLGAGARTWAAMPRGHLGQLFSPSKTGRVWTAAARPAAEAALSPPSRGRARADRFPPYFWNNFPVAPPAVAVDGKRGDLTFFRKIAFCPKLEQPWSRAGAKERNLLQGKEGPVQGQEAPGGGAKMAPADEPRQAFARGHRQKKIRPNRVADCGREPRRAPASAPGRRGRARAHLSNEPELTVLRPPVAAPPLGGGWTLSFFRTVNSSP